MTGTFEVSDGNTAVQFAYTKVTATIQAIIGNAAFTIWRRDTDIIILDSEFDTLSNQQKLDLVDAEVVATIRTLAKHTVDDEEDDTADDAKAARYATEVNL